MSQEIVHLIILVSEAIVLAILIVLRREFKAQLTGAIRELARELCEQILSDELEQLKAQVASARKLNLPRDSTNP